MATSERKLRVGIAGLGRIFPLHLRGYRDNEDAEIVGVFDPNAQHCADEARKLSGVVACNSFEALLDLEPDLVEILSPHPLHAEQAVAALQRGAHVSVQKPMAMSLEEADTMIEAARAAGRRLRVYENFRFLPAIEKAKQLLDSGAIGRPLHCRMRTLAGDPAHAWAVRGDTWRWRAEIFEKRQLGRLTYDDGHHKMATALWLFGPVRDVFAFIDHRETPHGRIDAPASLSGGIASPACM